MIGMIRLMAKLYPQEELIDTLIEGLQTFKITGKDEDRPMAQLMLLTTKWTDEGKDLGQIFDESQQIEKMSQMGESIFKNEN